MLADVVDRPALVERLSTGIPFVVVTAGAGYGKTTLLRLWERADPRPFRWVEDAADPALSEIVAAPSPTVFLVDDADRPELRDVLTALSDVVPAPGSTVVLAARALPERVRVRLMLRGGMLTVAEHDLAFGATEAAQILALPSMEVDEAVRVTEGWPAGLRLVRAAHDDGLPTGEILAGTDRIVRSFVRSEVTSGLDADTVGLLRTCAVFPSVTARLLDAVLGRRDSAARLSDLEERHLFLYPMDREGRRMRVHGLVRQALAADLDDDDPDAATRLRRDGAEWLAAQGDLAEALPLLLANGERRRALELIQQLVVPLFERGGIAEIVGMLREIGTDVSITDGYLAAMLSYTGVMTGDEIYARHWADVAEQLAAAEPERHETTVALLTLRAHRAPAGVTAMRADAEHARSILTLADRAWLPPTLMLCGIAAALCGDDATAAATLDEAIRFAEEPRTVPSLTLALTERALIYERSGHPVRSRALLDRAIAIVEGSSGAYPHAALPYALRAQDQARSGARTGARADLFAANAYRPLVGAAIPWLGVQLRIAIAGAAVPLGEHDIADTVLAEAEELLSALPDPGVLAERFTALRRAVEPPSDDTPAGAGRLSSAELRLLPMLTGHLSLEQIGKRLFVSRNTIKTQAASLYRKLGVTSRSEAVERAHALGLLPAGSRTG